MMGFVYTARRVMPGNAVRKEGMANRIVARRRARTPSAATVRHLAIAALHWHQRACGPDQILSRQTRHDYQGLVPLYVEVRFLPHRAPPGIIGPFHLRGFVLQL